VVEATISLGWFGRVLTRRDSNCAPFPAGIKRVAASTYAAAAAAVVAAQAAANSWERCKHQQR